MLLALLIIPLIGVLLLLPFSTSPTSLTSPSPLPAVGKARGVGGSFGLGGFAINKELSNRKLMKQIALGVTFLNLIVSIILWYQFDSNNTSYQFVKEYSLPYLEFCHFNVGVDGISIFFVLLTTFITPFCILSN